MWKHTRILSAVFAIAMVAFGWPVSEAGPAQTKANVPKPPNVLVLAEPEVRDLLLLMEPDKNGKISKQEWMRFMGEEFDRLDKGKKGELDAQELRRSSLQFQHTRSQDLGK
jgi:EF hand